MKHKSIFSMLMVISLCSLLMAGCKSNTQLIGTVGQPVDLGLTVLWADHNLGGECPSDSGISQTVIVKGKKNKVVDTASKMWHGKWHAPTIDQMNELIDECDWRLCVENGIEGYHVTGPNGNSIFLPRFAGDSGIDYWTSEVDKVNAPFVDFMYMNNHYAGLSYSELNQKKNIRPVMINTHYHKIAKEDRKRDPILLALEKQKAEARKAMQDKMSNQTAVSASLEKKMKDSLHILYIDTARIIHFTKSECDTLDNVYYRTDDVREDTLFLSGTKGNVTMRFKGLLAFVIVTETDEEEADYTVVYNNGKEMKVSKEKVTPGTECQSQVFYADKDQVTNICLFAGKKPVKLNRIRLFHSISIVE